MDVSTLLPFDNSSYGFDNIADVLGVSPVLMERYLVAARRISALAVGDDAEIIPTADTYRVRPDLSQDQPIEGLPLGTRGGILVKHTFPLDAEYTFKIDLRQATLNNVVGLEYPHTVVITIDGAEVHRATIGGKDDLVHVVRELAGEPPRRSKRGLAARVKVPAGLHAVGASFIAKSDIDAAGIAPADPPHHMGSGGLHRHAPYRSARRRPARSTTQDLATRRAAG